jgi:AcrR family transcriptional regulator
MASQPLSDDQREHLRSVVLDLAGAHGFDGWRISDVTAKTGISSRTLYKYYPSKEYLLLDAMIYSAGRLLEQSDGRGTGRTPRSRVLRTLNPLGEMLVASPTRGRAMVRALTCGQEAVAPMLQSFNERMHMVVARALAGGEPGDPQWAAAEVIQQVWFASVVSWASGITGADYIDESLVRALRLLGVNG